MSLKAKTDIENLIFEMESDEQISFNKIIKKVIQNKIVVFKITGAFILFGILIAALSPVEYTSKIVIMPELQEGGNPTGLLSQLGSIAGFAGLGNGVQQSLHPELYPKIVNSTPFYLSFLDHKQPTIEGNTTILFRDYYSSYISTSILGKLKKYTIGLPELIKDLIYKEVELGHQYQMEYLKITSLERDMLNYLKDRTRCSISKKTGLITIEVDMPNPLMSSLYVDFAFDYMMNYIVKYRLDKLNKNLDFLIARKKEVKEKYKIAQMNLADFADGNSNLNSEKAKFQKEQLTTEYQLAFKMYDFVSQQVEQAKISVQEETPVFEVLEPVEIPIEKSKPKRKLMVIIFLVLGIASSVTFIFIRELLNNTEDKI